jgi:hypothetical protein
MEIQRLLIIYVINLVLITIMAFIDWDIIEIQKKMIDNTAHIQRFVIKAIIPIPLIIIFIKKATFITFFLLGLNLMIIDWITFDLLLNLLRKKDWYYVGKTAQTDKWFQNNFKLNLTVKFIMLIITSYLVYYFNYCIFNG